MIARDVMTSPAITAKVDTAVLEIVDLMLKHKVSALPIVDDEGYLAGIVSEGDLIQRDEIDTLPHRSWWLSAIGSKAVLADEFVKSHGATADNVMTRKVVTAHEDTPLREIAELLERKRVKRVPILNDGKVTGIVSRANLLQALAVQKAAVEDVPSEDDKALRETFMEQIANEPSPHGSHLNGIVKQGSVYLPRRVN